MLDHLQSLLFRSNGPVPSSSILPQLLALSSIPHASTEANILIGLISEFPMPPEPFTPNYSQAFNAYTAALPHPVAASRLSFLTRHGRPGISADRKLSAHYASYPNLSLTWLETAASLGWAPAQHALATCYHDGVGTPRDLAQAFRWYAIAAGQGLPSSITVLGYCYADGVGTLRNPDRAFALYSHAASLGDPVAIYNVGYCLEIGVGVPKDPSTAVKYYLRAAHAGHAVAQNALGYCYEDGVGFDHPDLEQSIHWYRTSAEGGYMWAQCNLAFAYQHGRGVPEDAAEGAKWYEKAAIQGLARAQHNLGHCYQHGRGVTQDLDRAIYWYREAARNGSKYALHSLGFCYEMGEGVDRDLSRAKSFYTQAVNAGHGPAILAMAFLLLREEGSEVEAIEWFHRAAASGDPEAAYQLGLAYQRGVGVEQEPTLSNHWFRQGAKNGHGGAMYQLASSLCFPRFSWYERAAHVGNPQAMVVWGRLLIGERIGNGQGDSCWMGDVHAAAINVPKGLRWLRRAGKMGHLEAMHALIEVLPRHDPSSSSSSSRELTSWLTRAASRGDLDAIRQLIGQSTSKRALPRDPRHGVPRCA